MPPLVLSNAPDLEVEEGRFGTAPESFLHDFREKIADKLGIEEREIGINSIFKGANVIRYFGNPAANRGATSSKLNGRPVLAKCKLFRKSIAPRCSRSKQRSGRSMQGKLHSSIASQLCFRSSNNASFEPLHHD